MELIALSIALAVITFLSVREFNRRRHLTPEEAARECEEAKGEMQIW